MRPSDDRYLEDSEEFETAANRPRSSSARPEARPQQFSYSRSRKARRTTHFSGIHRRRQTRWTW
ncbi:MAG: hypothetical protein K8T25_09825 [Planctomycetia bacterium]|nr:hypothetical protein [Planctomycetia bacterium]